MSLRRSLIGALIVGLAESARDAIAIRAINDSAIVPTFAGPGSPRSTRNGGTATGAAAAKRAKRRRRNIAKHPRGAA